MGEAHMNTALLCSRRVGHVPHLLNEGVTQIQNARCKIVRIPPAVGCRESSVYGNVAEDDGYTHGGRALRAVGGGLAQQRLADYDRHTGVVR